MAIKILMVDDEPDAEDLFRQQFRRELRRGEIALDFCLSGEQALATLGGEDPPTVVVVLSDINMPGMSGIDLLSTIKERWPAMPVILISAYGDTGTEAEALRRGAQSLMPKPVDFAKLRSALAELPHAAAA